MIVRIKHLAVVGVALAVCLAAATPAAHAEPPPPTEDQLAEIALSLQGGNGSGSTARSSSESGFSNVSIDTDAGAVDLYWKGELPRSTAATVDAAPDGTDIRTHQAKYSLADFEEAVPALWRSYPTARIISFNTDGSGATVTLSPDEAVPPEETEPEGPSMAVTDFVADDVTPAIRQNDASPWTAGARIKSFGCTTGFGVVYGSTKYLLTAAHCGSNGQTATDGAGHTIGTTFHERTAVDSMLIKVSSLSGYAYDGAWNNTTNYRKPVKGTVASVVGRTTCSSGSFTGVHCGLKIINVNSTFNWGEGAINGAIAQHPSTTGVAAGTGDSGGPVFTVKADNSSQILATGLISGISSFVSCGSYPSGKCGRNLLYVPIDRIVTYYPLSLWPG